MGQTDSLAPDWDFAFRRDASFQIHLSRNMAIAILVSLLLHALALFVFYRHHLLDMKTPIRTSSEPFDVQLAPTEKPRVAAPMREPVAENRTRRVIAVKKAPSRAYPVPALPEPVRESKPSPEPKMSFLDYVNAARARRSGGESAGAKVETMGPPQESHPPGTNGIFQIIRMNDSSAEFSFLGWHSEYSNSHREVFEVDAGADGDVQLAVVRKMVAIIRRYYKEDFNWDSERLGRVVVLSARIQDTAELEAFMRKEFFSTAASR